MIEKKYKLMKKAYLLISFVLSGCATTHWVGAGKQNSDPYGSGPMEIMSQNLIKAEEASGQIEYKYIPVPIPGQLMPMPSNTDAKKFKKTIKGLNATTLANKKAIREPKEDQFFNSMLTYTFMPGAVYTIFTYAGKITDIELEPEEKVLNIAAADSANWQIQTSPSGDEKHSTIHILVKPMISNAAENNLVILTNKRVYHLYLKITTNKTFMISVKWHYPEKPNSLFIKKEKDKNSSKTDSYQNYVDPSQTIFNYQWALTRGKKPEWFPEQIFHDEHKTYIRFPRNFNNITTLPILYIPDGNGGYSTMSNWRLHNKTTMVVDGVLSTALLETGSIKGERTIVKIRMVPNVTK